MSLDFTVEVRGKTYRFESFSLQNETNWSNVVFSSSFFADVMCWEGDEGQFFFGSKDIESLPFGNWSNIKNNWGFDAKKTDFFHWTTNMKNVVPMWVFPFLIENFDVSSFCKKMIARLSQSSECREDVSFTKGRLNHALELMRRFKPKLDAPFDFKGELEEIRERERRNEKRLLTDEDREALASVRMMAIDLRSLKRSYQALKEEYEWLETEFSRLKKQKESIESE